MHAEIQIRLYLRSIGRAMEGVVTIMTAGIADYSRKTTAIGAFLHIPRDKLTDPLDGD
jgi:hypothetical protein